MFTGFAELRLKFKNLFPKPNVNWFTNTVFSLYCNFCKILTSGFSYNRLNFNLGVSMKFVLSLSVEINALCNC